MRTKITTVVAITAALATAVVAPGLLAGSPTAQADAPATGFVTASATLQQIGLEAAIASHDSSPTAMTMARTTYGDAQKLAPEVDPGFDSSRSVVVLQLEGDFDAEWMSHPPGTETPNGTSLTLIVDDVTGRVIQTRLTRRAAPDLAQLGGTVHSMLGKK